MNGSGSTENTFLWKTITYMLRIDKKNFLDVALSSIASLLLLGGRTAHCKFKIPLQYHENSYCSINKRSHLAKLLKKLIS